MMPEADKEVEADPSAEAVDSMLTIVELGRLNRAQRKVTLKMPVRSITIGHASQAWIDEVKPLEEYIKAELSALEIEFTTAVNADHLLSPIFKNFGPKVGKDMGKVRKGLTELTRDQVKEFQRTKKMTVCGYDFGEDDLEVLVQAKECSGHQSCTAGDDVSVTVDYTPEERLELMFYSREIANRVQKMRKEAGLRQDDEVGMWAEAENAPMLEKTMKEKEDYINELLMRTLVTQTRRQGHEPVILEDTHKIGSEKVKCVLTAPAFHFNGAEMLKLAGSASVREGLQCLMTTFKYSDMGDTTLILDGKKYELKRGVHFALSATQAPWL